MEENDDGLKTVLEDIGKDKEQISLYLGRFSVQWIHG